MKNTRYVNYKEMKWERLSLSAKVRWAVSIEVYAAVKKALWVLFQFRAADASRRVIQGSGRVKLLRRLPRTKTLKNFNFLQPR
jgi:hypothetical protein